MKYVGGPMNLIDIDLNIRGHQCNACNSNLFSNLTYKVEHILNGGLVSIPSPSPLVKIQTMGEKVCLRCKGKTLLGVVNKLLKTKRLLTSLKVKVKVMGSNSGYLLKSFLLY